jgi:hypothetical protein
VTIPCSIREVNIEGVLCDLDSNINIMTPSLADRLTIGEPKGAHVMLLTLADHCELCIWGIIRNILVKVNDLLVPVDFVVLDILVEEETPLILGKPFLAARSALVENEQKELKNEEAHQEEEEDKREDQERPLVEIEDSTRETSYEDLYGENESMRELEYMLSPDYDSLLKNMLHTNQASSEKFEAQGGNLVENTYDVEK